MENYSYSSYPDSRDSSPRSREIDCENQSWEEPPSSNYKVKFMCSYNGKIQPRPHDNQLAYVGGETKILAVDRSIKFSAIKSKLSSICNDADLCFKYQLPGEDLDALISVTNDEDLEHMMLEYDRLLRGSAKPARLRLFLFPVNSAPASFSTGDPKSERQWFVDALNSVQLEGSSPPAAAAAAAAGNPDFLFGLDKGFPANPAAKFQDSAPAQTAPDVVATKDMSAGSDCGSEDRHVVSDPQLMSQAEIQRQIHELQRMQIANQEQAAMYQRKSDEINPRAYVGDYYTQKVPEKIAPAPVPVPVQMQIPATYMTERHMTTAGGVYPMAPAPVPGPAEHQMYLIQTPTGVYQAVRPVTNPVSQSYYGVQRVVQETYREQPVYNAVAQQGKVVGGAYNEGNIPVVQHQQQQQQQQMYYTTQGGGIMAAAASYQTVAPVAVDSRQGGGGVVLNQEGA
ncbi:hypothetical protein CMV_014629 [Castanea mollissima]|uniref:PB1 domain-containing protein n=1 Tax=Castanea mollissima TaxID=60419 RepID=A0A8J4QX36_9ROSI|nr:hypothetical protein CMV_014629 [Castanea mollissima]